MNFKKTLLGALAGIGFASVAHAQGGPITIGVPVGLSGANSIVAPSAVQSAQLAVKQINAAGGVLGRKLVVDVADDESGAAGAQKAFDYLVYQKNVDVLIADGNQRRPQRRPADRGERATSLISTPPSTRGIPAARTCSKTAGFPNSRCRRSPTIS